MHDELLLHVSLHELNELIVQDELAVRLSLSWAALVWLVFILLHEQMEQAHNVALFELQAKLVLVLPEKELDEGALADDQELSMFFLVVNWSQERQHQVSERSNLLRGRKSLHYLHQDLVHLLQEFILLQVLDVSCALADGSGCLLSWALVESRIHFLRFLFDYGFGWLIAFELAFVL